MPTSGSNVPLSGSATASVAAGDVVAGVPRERAIRMPMSARGTAGQFVHSVHVAAGPDWNADTDFDVRLQDVPLNNRRPDVTVYRADSIDVTPTRPEHVLLVVEVVSPGSETTDRIVKADQYAKAGIQFYWRVEQAANGALLLYTYVLDPVIRRYREGEVFTDVVRLAAPFLFEIDLRQI